MRMVIEVNEDLHRKLKEKARGEGRPYSHVVRGLIEQYVTERKVVPITKQDQAAGRTRR